MFRVVGHEVLSPERWVAHTRLPEEAVKSKEEIKQLRETETRNRNLGTAVCKHTCMEQDEDSFCRQHFGLVLSGCEGRRDQETGDACWGRSSRSLSHPAPPLTKYHEYIIDSVRNWNVKMLSSIYYILNQ